jgi:hypothetical protein
MVLPYSQPNEDLLRDSHGTLYVCKKRGQDELTVVNVKTIQSVVAMIPFPLKADEEGKPDFIGTFYVAEKPFHDLTGDVEEYPPDSDSDEADD